MNRDLKVLLELQAEDDVISGLEARVAEFQPQIRELDRSLKLATEQEAKARQALDEAERNEHELQNRLEEQKQLHERSVSQLDAVRKPREAAAAMTQAEVTRRFLQDMERETQLAVARVVELRAQLKMHEARLEEIRATQREERASIDAQVGELQSEIASVRERRGGIATGVPKAILFRYEKLRTRRGETSVFAILGSSCGNCDMTVPIQRRNMMSASGNIEPCEACGVLLYISE